MVGRDNPLEVLDEPSAGNPGGRKERDDSKQTHNHSSLFDETDHLVNKFNLYNGFASEIALALMICSLDRVN